MSVIFLIHLQQVHVLLYLKQFFYLNVLVYHQNKFFVLKQQYHFFLAKFACANLAVKCSVVNLLNSGIVIHLS